MSHFITGERTRSRLAARLILIVVIAIILSSSACKRGPLRSNEVAYVAAPQANLRDRVAAIYNKVGVVKNGEKVEILDRQKRFVRVRTTRGEEGWMEQRHLVGEDIFDAFTKLADENRNTPVQGRGATRAELNMHVTPARDSEKLYQLADTEKLDLLKRATAERPSKTPAVKAVEKLGSKNTDQTAAKANEKGADKDDQPDRKNPAQPTPPPQNDTPKAYDDWWLARNSQGHVGWVLARMIDLDVPLEIAQYSEGQRIQAAFVINKLADEDKQVPQYLVLFSENKDGMPFDYNQARVFTWNVKKHRYETAYRERGLFGVFPVTTGSENFDKEGVLPTFTLHVKNEDGSISERKYKLNQPIVRRVLAPGEQPQKQASVKTAEADLKARTKGKKHRR